MMCSYGCGQASVIIFKNGKGCCSSTVNHCPAKRQRDSILKLGKPRSSTAIKAIRLAKCGKPAWNTGKTKETDERIALKSKKLSERYQRGELTPHSTSLTDEHKRQLRNNINIRYENGWKPKAGRCEKITYSSPIAGVVMLDGTWELAVAKYLDDVGVEWQRNTDRFPYTDVVKSLRTYTPDFYLPSLNCYVEVKGYETELDRLKWEAFPRILYVWKKAEMLVIKEGKPERFQELFAKQIAPCLG